jgi:hypothetical protein
VKTQHDQAARSMLAEELNTLLENITKTEDTEIDTPLNELITEGETADLEFKSSFRWSLKGGSLDNRLEVGTPRLSCP